MKKASKQQAASSSTGQPSGFTVIELMIVLSIAGVILAIVLLAVPTLNRNARNHTRKEAVDFIASEMATYYSNNGTFPMYGTSKKKDQRKNFVKSLGTGGIAAIFTIRYSDKDGSHEYPFEGSGIPADPEDAFDEISIEPGHRCNTDPGLRPGDIDYPLVTAATSGDNNYRAYAIWTMLEKAPVYCIDNAVTGT